MHLYTKHDTVILKLRKSPITSFDRYCIGVADWKMIANLALEFVQRVLKEIYCIMRHFSRSDPTRKRFCSAFKVDKEYNAVPEEPFTKLEFSNKEYHQTKEYYLKVSSIILCRRNWVNYPKSYNRSIFVINFRSSPHINQLDKLFFLLYFIIF